MTLTRRQNYYEKLLRLGIPDIVAASMAAQSPNCIIYGNSVDVLYGFHAWEETLEGPEFWMWFSHEIQAIQS